MAVITCHGKHTAYFLKIDIPVSYLPEKVKISIFGRKWLVWPTSSGSNCGPRLCD